MTKLLCRAAVTIAAMNSVAALLWAGPITVVDVVPFNESSETLQNTEPTVAVNPSNPSQLIVSAFGDPAANPYFTSNNSNGLNWTNNFNYSHVDTSVGFAPSGNAYASFMHSPGTGDFMNVASSTNPVGNAGNPTGTAFANLGGNATVGPPRVPPPPSAFRAGRSWQRHRSDFRGLQWSAAITQDGRHSLFA